MKENKECRFVFKMMNQKYYCTFLYINDYKPRPGKYTLSKMNTKIEKTPKKPINYQLPIKLKYTLNYVTIFFN